MDILSDPNIQSESVTDPTFINLVLSGGSTRGIAHIGCLQALIDQKLIDLHKLKGISSVSAGSLLGLLITLGFELDTIWTFIQNLDFSKLICPDPFLLLSSCGVDDGSKINSFVKDVLEETVGNAEITFQELFGLKPIFFTAVGTCLTRKEVVYFNHINTPHMPVHTAIKISMALPGIFCPVIYADEVYVDGALIQNYPFDVFNDDIPNTIGIMIHDNYDTSYSCSEEYIIALLNLMFYICHKKNCESYKQNTICINKGVSEISSFNFDIDHEKKQLMYDSGYEAFNQWFKQKS